LGCGDGDASGEELLGAGILLTDSPFSVERRAGVAESFADAAIWNVAAGPGCLFATGWFVEDLAVRLADGVIELDGEEEEK